MLRPVLAGGCLVKDGRARGGLSSGRPQAQGLREPPTRGGCYVGHAEPTLWDVKFLSLPLPLWPSCLIRGREEKWGGRMMTWVHS